MQQIMVNAPGSGEEYVDTKEAMRFLGLERKPFEALLAREDWCRPVYFGRVKRWHVNDIAALSWIHRRRCEVPGRKKSEQSGASE